jgi:hypothetical protein
MSELFPEKIKGKTVAGPAVTQFQTGFRARKPLLLFGYLPKPGPEHFGLSPLHV